MKNVQLLGRIVIGGQIFTKTALHIGGSPGALAIGNVDMPVIRDTRTNQPYIPGSSLKGKMRSQSEKLLNAPQNTEINRGKPDGGGRVAMHTAKSKEEYQTYWVNPLFGVTGDAGDWVNAPNRLIVRDIPLDEKSRAELISIKTDLPFTEVKWEAAIDRVTSAATPRQIERVPAGAVFGPLELVLSLYLPDDVKLLGSLLTALQLVEDDYLGGQGSRGSGKVEFRQLTVQLRRGEDYTTVDAPFKELTLAQLLEQKSQLLEWVKNNLAQS